jgi:hypothetical protein
MEQATIPPVEVPQTKSKQLKSACRTKKHKYQKRNETQNSRKKER